LPIALFGHSLGGIIAPLVGPVDAIAAFGASALPWTEHARETSRRQRRLKGFRGVELETELGHWHEMLGLVCKEGWTPARAFTERPHLRAIRSRECDGETLYGRHVSLVRALETLDLPAAWSAFAGRTLAMHGEVDWISSREDSEGIVRACGERGELAELPGIGHDLMRHESAQSSFAEPHKGAWDGTVARRLLDWLRL
jgi:pimeloyl-ACP methyl ester carboxylesterase